MSLRLAVGILDDLIDHFKPSKKKRMTKSKSYCYCKSRLKRQKASIKDFEEMYEEKRSFCTSCCKLVVGEMYACVKKSCYYKSITKAEYSICLDCHRLQPSINTKDNTYTLILNKFNHSLEIIS